MTPTAERLRRAIAEWPSASYTKLGPRARPSVKSFSRLASAHAKGAGTSRNMLLRYFEPDGPEPPDQLLRAAAKVLGVRLEWLRTGEGAMTALAEKQRERARVTERVIREVGERLLDPFEPAIEWGSVEGYALLSLVYQWDGVLHPGPRADSPERYRAVADRIVPILDAPFAALGLEPDTIDRGPQFSHYVRAMLLALSLAPTAGKRLTKEKT